MLPHSRKRTYRQRVTCSECDKELDSDYCNRHAKQHEGKKVRFLPVLEKSQTRLCFVGPQQQNELRATSSQATDESLDDDVSAYDEPQTVDKQPDLAPETTSLPSSDAQCQSDSDSSSISEQEQGNLGLLAETADTSCNIERMQLGPNQPVLNEYLPKKFGRETSKRDFNPEWFKQHSWLSYDVSDCCGSWFPCNMFQSNSTFKFNNWKKPQRLTKHSLSSAHQMAMAQWLAYNTNKRKQTSILMQLNDEHDRQVKENREYLRIVIECVVFTAQQNIAQRGHCEDRSALDQPSDVNRGNFLELLNMRSRDLPWLGEK